MGIVLGKIDVEMPAHIVVHRAATYQVWKYPGQVAAVVRARDMPERAKDGALLRDDEFTSPAFRALARYIGVFGKPENRAKASDDPNKGGGENIAMTAPVVMSDESQKGGEGREGEKIAMTAPVVMSGDSHKIAMTAPVVMSNNEQEQQEDGQTMKFLLPALYKSVEDAPIPTNPAVKLEMVDDGRCEAVFSFSGSMNMNRTRKIANEFLQTLQKDNVTITGEWTFQGYNPPFTLPWLCRNEIHVPVDPQPYAHITEDVTSSSSS